MSRTDPPRQYELVDADGESEEELAEENSNDDNNDVQVGVAFSNYDHQPPPPRLPPTLPSGQIIDGKNTLQSFDNFVRVRETTTNRSTSSTATPGTAGQDPPPSLPNGDVIDAKNIHRSYEVADNSTSNSNANVTHLTNSGMGHVTIGSNHNSMGIATIGTNSNSGVAVSARGSVNNDDGNIYFNNVPAVHAVAVPSLVVVDAEPVSSIRDSQPPPPPLPPPPPAPQPPLRPIRSATFWYINSAVIALIAVAAALGLYCGTGNCSSGSDAPPPPTNSNPVVLTPPPPNPPPVPLVDVRPSVPPVVVPEESSVTLEEFIRNITLSDQDITVDGTNPESMALTWMLGNAELKDAMASMVLSLQTNSTVSFRVRQLYPLLTMWFQQTETSKWNITQGWLNDTNECNWYGISCRAMDLGGYIGMQNVTTNIDFYTGTDTNGNNYGGTIPADLGLLTMLERLDIQFNKVTGILPESIGQWTALTYLDVYSNSLTGTLPASIGEWTALTFIRVRNNTLTGTLPESIGKWTSLITFIVRENNLNGTLPQSIGQWSQIKQAVFLENSFTGTMPAGICLYINVSTDDQLEVDCDKIECTCCTNNCTVAS
jgi:Leucine-rich repeat (LRR) protein